MGFDMTWCDEHSIYLCAPPLQTRDPGLVRRKTLDRFQEMVILKYAWLGLPKTVKGVKNQSEK